MKSLLSVAGIFLFAALVSFSGQEVPLPPSETGETPPPAASIPEIPADAGPAPQLIPPELLPAPTPAKPAATVLTIPQLDETFKPQPLTPDSEKRRLHQQWRILRNRVEDDPELRAALATSKRARTDLEQRKLLRSYYMLMYAKISAIAPAGFRPYLEARKNEALGALPQPHVRPIPTPKTKPSPSPAPGAATATPSPSPSPFATPSVLAPSLIPSPSVYPRP